MSQKFIGLYKQKEVFIEKNKEENTWSMILKHPKHGDLRKDGIKYKPKVGMAKRYFRHKLKNLNEESEKTNGMFGLQRKLPQEGSGSRVSPEEIESWLPKTPRDWHEDERKWLNDD